MTDESLPTFQELTSLSAEQLRRPATMKTLSVVVDHCADALLRLRGRIVELEKRISNMEKRK